MNGFYRSCTKIQGHNTLRVGTCLCHLQITSNKLNYSVSRPTNCRTVFKITLFQHIYHMTSKHRCKCKMKDTIPLCLMTEKLCQ